MNANPQSVVYIMTRFLQLLWTFFAAMAREKTSAPPLDTPRRVGIEKNLSR